MTIKQRIITFFVLVLSSCFLVFYYFFIYDPLPPNVEIVISASEKPDGWLLSPNGDKIFYLPIVNGQYKPTLLFLDTYQKHEMGIVVTFGG